MSLVRTLGRAAGGALLFVLAAASGAVAHRNLPAPRRAVLAHLNAALATVVPGRIAVDRLGALGLDGVGAVEVTLFDPTGAAVVHAQGLTARIDVEGLIASLRTGGPVVVDLAEASAASVDVNLDRDPGGSLRLVQALVPGTPAAPSPPGRGVQLRLPELDFDRVTVRGSPASGFPLDIDATGVKVAVELSPGSLRVDLDRAEVTARGLPPGATTHGSLEAHLEQPSPHGGARAARVRWNGTVGAIAATAFAMLDGDAVHAVVDAPALRGQDLASVWPSSPLVGDGSARIEGVGLLPVLSVSAHATAGSGVVTVGGPVLLDGTPRAAIHFETTSLDARALTAQAPETRLDARGDVLLARNATGAAGAAVALEFSGAVGPTSVPRTEVTGELSRDVPPSNATHARARLVIREPGAPSTVDATLAPKGSALDVAFDASVVVPDLDRVLRLGPIAKGNARLQAHGHFDTGTQRVDANVTAAASGVQAGPVTIGNLSLDARASGPVATPDLDGEIHGRDLSVAGFDVAHLRAALHGPASGAKLSLGLGGRDAHLQADATVSVLGASASVRDLRVRAEHGGESASFSAPAIALTANEQRLDDAELRGFGAPIHVMAKATPAAVSVTTHSHKIELERIARFAGLSGAITGHVSMDVDATLHKTRGEGHVAFDVTGASLGPVGDSEAHVDLTLDGRKISGMVSGRVGDVGTLSMQSTSLEMPGTAPLGVTSLRAITGSIDAQGHVDLARLASQLPAGALPLSRIAGALDLTAHAERDSASDPAPTVSARVTTSRLVATGPESAPWTLQGVDLQTDVQVDGTSAHTSLEARAIDRRGLLVSLNAASDALPYAHLFAFARDEPLLPLLRPVPFTASVAVPGRPVAAFPALLGTREVRGDLAGTMAWSGSLDSPTVDVKATLAHGGTSASVLAVTLDLALTGHYDGKRVEADLTASSRSQTLLDAKAQLDVAASDLVGRLGAVPGASAPLPWTASTQVALTRFPLQSVAALDDRQVRGHLSGSFSLQGLHDDARATADLSSDDLSVGDITCKSATTSVTVDGKALDGQTQIAQADGTLQATVHAGTHWGAAMLPALDASQLADLAVNAKAFRVDLVQPLVESVFAELDGRVDADVHVHADPSKRLLQPQGTVKLTGGVVEVAGFGGEFHDATAQIDLTPDGVVKLQNASAMGLSGKIEAAASARFDGLSFDGARASVQVNRKQPLPLVVDGVQVGTFDGQLGITVDPVVAAKGGGYDVKVDVPQMQLQLPLQSARTVQPLGALADVTVGTRQPGGGFAPLPLDGPAQSVTAKTGASPVRVTVALGQNVVVKRSTTLQVSLGGSPTIVVGDDVRASGQVRLLRGSLDVQGKTFTIETGTVTFVSDPTNPQVVLTASWPAPDGTTIYADFIGPLKTGKVTLRADPPRPQDEILSLILFGTTDEQTSSGSSPTAQQSSAVGAAGGAATAPINQALGGVNQMLDSFGLVGGISTRVDTSQATPRPEVQIQIARDLAIQVAWVLGVPPPGSNPDTTLFTLDWRFLRSWSLETTVGDAGTSILDLIWQHRY
jgi:translocation and assembly module TamB